MHSPLRTSLLLALLVATGTSCGGDSTGPRPTGKLVASPTSIALTDSASTRDLFLTTEPSGGSLTWRVTGKPDWVTVSPDSGKISGSAVTLKVSAVGLLSRTPGTLSGTVDILSDGGTASVPVTAVVPANPVPTPSTATVTVAGTADSTAFDLTNTGNATLTWQLTGVPAWMRVTPSSGTIGVGAKTTIRVVPTKDSLPLGTTTGSLTIASNARAGTTPLPFSVQVDPTPKIELSTALLDIRASVTTRSFVIRNIGRGPLTWSLGALGTGMTASPDAGTTAAKDSTIVTLTLARASLPAGDVVRTITPSSNAVNATPSLVVEIEGSGRLIAGMRRVLDHRVLDAEYHAGRSLLVTVSADPAQLNVLDVEAGTWSSIALAKPPTSLAVRPDGLFAAVGHDGLVSYVDLTTRQVSRTYAVTTNAIDVILPSNGYVYVFPRTDQWEEIHSVNLTTGAETLSGTASIYAGTVARLHPSGEYIYGADNGLSPSDFEKYDIRAGTAQVLYDSPYHGDYAFNGEVWISEDGARLVARSGNVFRSSTVRAEDMTYVGALPGATIVRWAADSKAKTRLYVFGASATYGDYRTPELRVYDAAFNTLKGTATLPKLTANGQRFTVDGYWVFPTTAGDRLLALTKALPGSGLVSDWMLTVLDGDAMP